MAIESQDCIFPAKLAQEFLEYAKSQKQRETDKKSEVATTEDLTNWADVVQRAFEIYPAGQADLVVPTGSFLNATNPGVFPKPVQRPLTDVDRSANVLRQQARQALFGATCATLRSAPKCPMTCALLGAASKAWMAQLCDEFSTEIATSGITALQQTRDIWLKKRKKSLVHLGDCAPLPPYFDINARYLEALYLECVPEDFDYGQLSGQHLHKLRYLKLYVRGKQQPDVGELKKLLPHLTECTIGKGLSGIIYRLQVPGYRPLS